MTPFVIAPALQTKCSSSATPTAATVTASAAAVETVCELAAG